MGPLNPKAPAWIRECPAITPADFREAMRNPTSPDTGTVQYADSGGELTYRLERRADDIARAIEIGFRLEGEACGQRIVLVQQKLAIGGLRYYFRGPDCGEKREKLILTWEDGRFLCRKCSSACYEANQRSNDRHYERVDRWMNRLHTAARKLGLDTDQPLPPSPPRPTGMHESTYRSHRTEYRKCYKRACEGLHSFLKEVRE